MPILPKIRDNRFITIRRGGMLTDADHRLLAIWAAECADHVLPIFEKACPSDDRPRRAIEATRAWVNGEIKMMQARDFARAAQNAAREIKYVSEAARMAALSAGQAAVVAHVATHELGAAAYAIRAVMEAVPKPEREAARVTECDWQRSRLPEQIRELVLDDERLRNDICWFAFGEEPQLTTTPEIWKNMVEHLIQPSFPTMVSLHGKNPMRSKTGGTGRTEIMAHVTIRLISENKKNFLPLLLLGDEQESYIDKYLERGDLFALYDGDLKSVCVVTDEGGGILEIQNLATNKRYQQQGYASRLIDYVVEHYVELYEKIILGTGDVPRILAFYERRGFTQTHRIPDYFTTHYIHPIIEDGVLLKDKVYLERKLT